MTTNTAGLGAVGLFRRLLALLLGIIGIVLIGGGGWLATLGGSLYYLVAGVMVALAVRNQ